MATARKKLLKALKTLLCNKKNATTVSLLIATPVRALQNPMKANRV